ncbi:MAG: PAS domain S-box protein [Bacteroidetes bacterium]|nr:PAS domain S-box protein [Bacteroidota bacterium]MBT3749138.1 PAS domain S-box protein [Bacteroidota bacterium]MBT4400580.1 PAS domain S-box protein [Bacteroidota bacterium]MBT4412183.1 PAS domain S-box protein [Bacteroidota bacterium]MBT7093411.1 PAS domain S-box protein [Bacteroidota bacterium]
MSKIKVMNNQDKTTREQLSKEIVQLKSRIVELEDSESKRNESEEALGKSNALLSSILESLDNVIMFALDANYRYLSFNKAHVKEMKYIYDADIEIGRRIYHYMPNEEDRLLAEINYKRVLSGERFVEIQEYGEADNRFWYELFFNPIIDSSHNVTGFTVFVANITKRKEAENKIISLSRIFEDSLNEIFLFRADTLKFTQVNTAAQKNLGYSMDEILNMTPLDFKPEFTEESFARLVEPLLKGEKHIIVFETVHQRKDQSLYMVEVHLQVLEFDHGSMFAAIIMDVTERKNAEQDLIKHRETLEETVEERTKELKEQNQKLDKAMKVFVGREHMIRKLQRELSALKGE